MKQFFIVSIFSTILFSCSGEKAQTNSVSAEIELDTVSIVEPLEEENEEPEVKQTYKFLHSNELQGVWGDFSYLGKLKETNSVTLANEYASSAPGTDLKIGSIDAVINHVFFMEEQFLSEERYELEKISKDSLYLLDKKYSEKTLFLKISDLPPNTNSVWSIISDSSYLVIDKMKWEWFSGEYKYIDVINNTERIVRFTKDGKFIDGDKKIAYSPHSFESPTPQDYLFFEEGHNDYRYSLIEYEEGVFNCYGVEDFEDWEEPFVKTRLEYKLVKQN